MSVRFGSNLSSDNTCRSWVPGWKNTPGSPKPATPSSALEKARLVLSLAVSVQPSIFGDALDEFLNAGKDNASARKLAFFTAYGANINALNPKGDPPLTQAIKARNRAAIDFFLRQPRLNVNRTNQFQQTPLTIAILNHQWNTVERLLQQGANPIIKDDLEKNAFDWLAIQGQPKKLKKLAALCKEPLPDPSLENWKERSEIQLQRRQRFQAEPYRQKKQLLWNACAQGSVSNLFFARQLFPDTTPLLNNELTPLAIVAGNHSLKRAKLLLGMGDSVNQTGRNKTSPLMLAAFASGPKMVQLLLDAGAEIDYRSKRGQTALCLAAIGGMPEAAEVLLKSGANPNIADEEGFYPLDYAVQHGEADVVEKLLACPRLDLVNQGRSAERRARKNGYPEISASILRQLAIVENRENCGLLKNLWLTLWDYWYLR